MDHFDKVRLESACQEAQNLGVTAAVVAIRKDTGQIVIHNIGDSYDRGTLYKAFVLAKERLVSEVNGRIGMREGVDL